MSKLLRAAKLLPRDDDAPQHGCLDQVSGIELVAPHCWRWNLGSHVAAVTVAPGDAVRIALELAEPHAAPAALKANHELPGNLRFATIGHNTLLVADTQYDGEAHLPRTFGETKTGLLRALGEDRPDSENNPLTVATVNSAIEACRWDEDHVVDLDGAWEFRPRLRGDATPVRAEIVGSELRMSRTVVPGMGGESTRDAISAQALRFNAQLRHARLATADDMLVGEARLHSGQLNPYWLETTARAVAVACRHTADMLGILAESDAVADLYVATFSIGK